MSQHYEVAVLPARARKPKDKAVIEANVRVIQQRVLSKIRNEEFYSLNELECRLSELLEEFNDKPMQKHKVSRRELFEALDRSYSRALKVDDY